jgi:hypothetical protein
MPTTSLRFAALLPILAACSTGDWVVTTWGEEFIEDGIAAEEFEDGCSAVYDRFDVEFISAALLDPNNATIADVAVGRFALTDPGPQQLGTASVSAGTYERVFYEIGSETGDAVSVAGTVTCGADTVSFDWSFDINNRYRCLPLSVAVPADGEVLTDLTIHGDHLFFDSLEDEGAVLRGQAVVDADADGDGTVSLSELAAVDISGLDYPLGLYTDITDLAGFITSQVEKVGHVDGEGHCYVD